MDEPGFYIIKNGVLTGYVGAAQHAFIPEGVRHIAPYVFARHDHLVNVTFPKGLESIGEGAFSGCDYLVGISLPQSILLLTRTVRLPLRPKFPGPMP